MPYLPYKPGTEVCNAFDANDCATVTGEGLAVTFSSLPKIYLPKDSTFFNAEVSAVAVKIEQV